MIQSLKLLKVLIIKMAYHYTNYFEDFEDLEDIKPQENYRLILNTFHRGCNIISKKLKDIDNLYQNIEKIRVKFPDCVGITYNTRTTTLWAHYNLINSNIHDKKNKGKYIKYKWHDLYIFNNH